MRGHPRNQRLGWRARQEQTNQSSWGAKDRAKDEASHKKKIDESKADNVVDTEMIEADGKGAGDKADSALGLKCSRCFKRGHLASKCEAELYCVICDGHDHVNHKCPILKQSRPVAHVVGYAVHGLGFYHIPHPPLPKSKKETRQALISVVGGELSRDQVVMQLQRIFAGKWTWELTEQDNNCFVTRFPSMIELQRAVAFGGADVKDVEGKEGLRL